MKEQTPFSTPVPTPLKEKVLELFKDEDQFLSGRASSAARSGLGTLYDSLRRIWTQANLEQERQELTELSEKLEWLRSRPNENSSGLVMEYVERLRKYYNKNTDWQELTRRDIERWKSDIYERKENLRESKELLMKKRKGLQLRLKERLDELRSESEMMKGIWREESESLRAEFTDLEEKSTLLDSRRQALNQRKSCLGTLSEQRNNNLNQLRELSSSCDTVSQELQAKQKELQQIYSELEKLEESSAIFRTRLLEAGRINEEDYPEYLIKRSEVKECSKEL